MSYKGIQSLEGLNINSASSAGCWGTACVPELSVGERALPLSPSPRHYRQLCDVVFFFFSLTCCCDFLQCLWGFLPPPHPLICWVIGATALQRSWRGMRRPGSEEGTAFEARGRELGNNTRSLATLPWQRNMEWSRGYWFPQWDLPQHEPQSWLGTCSSDLLKIHLALLTLEGMYVCPGEEQYKRGACLRRLMWAGNRGVFSS